MNIRRFSITMILAIAAGLVLAPAATQSAFAFNGDTEDVLYMSDGRILHGEILEETPSEIKFKYVDPHINSRIELTISKSDISEIERDVEKKEETPAAERPKRETSSASNTKDRKSESDFTASYGAVRAAADNTEAPKFYIVPMKGQMGTDVCNDVYMEMLDDIRSHDPDYLIIVMDCAPPEQTFTNNPIAEQGLGDPNSLDMYRDVIGVFKEELRNIPQILWVKDSVGISSAIALAWKDMYLAPEAQLGGLGAQARFFDYLEGDANIHGKYREAYMAWLKGFAEHGQYDHLLVEAMVMPEKQLSASWKGREVVWSPDITGEILVDATDQATVNFDARTAEDLRLSDGTVETIDDLALLMGIREYRVAGGSGEEIYEDFREDWRRVLDQCGKLIQDYGKYMSWANGQDTLKYLGQAKSSLEQILNAIKRYRPVEIRMQSDYGVNEFALVTLIEQHREQIRALRSNRGGAGGRGGGGMGGGRGGRR